ncbi:MAG: anti-sigma factor [Patescibacteria group bacterium]
MRQQSFRHRGAKSSGIGGSILLIIAAVVGVFVVYQLILWFRSSSAKTIANDVVTAAVDTVDAKASLTTSLNSTAVLKVSDGSSAGTVVRSGTVEVPSYSLVANLVALAPDTMYEAWLVKDGLADVKSVGALNPRADGSWAATFSAKDPLDYPTIVIMLEPNDGDAEPSGNRIAEGRFE